MHIIKSCICDIAELPGDCVQDQLGNTRKHLASTKERLAEAEKDNAKVKEEMKWQERMFAAVALVQRKYRNLHANRAADARLRDAQVLPLSYTKRM